MKKLLFTGFTLFFLSCILLQAQTQYWFKTSCPNNMNIMSIAVSSGGTVFAGTQGDGVYSSADGGGTWVQTAGSGVSFNYLAFSSSGELYAATDNGILHYTGSGNVWEQLSTDDASVVAINSTGEIFAGLSLTGISKSTDNGVTWNPANNGLTSNLSKMTASMAIDPNENIFIGTCEGAFKSTNNGNNWNSMGLTDKAVNSMKINKQGSIFAGTSDGILYLSTDHGGTWNKINTWTETDDIRGLELTPEGSIFAGTLGEGVYMSGNGGANWAQINSGLNGNLVYTFALSPDGFIYASTMITNSGTNTGGVFKSVNPVSGINDLPELIKNIRIYPNPSQSEIFILSNESGTMSLCLSDILGNNVVIMQDKFIGENSPYRIELNKISAGVYFLSIRIKGNSYTKRIIVN